jgi:hypothetical protein
VYSVRDSRAPKQSGEEPRVALKRVRADGPQGARHRALLEREFHTLAQIQHPRIIEVYDYGLDEDSPYYTMELLDGDDLRTRGKVPWRQACALLCDVASSLAILHSRGLIHRDVSARNVRCTGMGRAKLIDFGAMMPMGPAKDVVGTPPFVAPEALQLQVLDARVDLFALGALGYFMLTGRNAFPARKLSDLRDVWRTEPMPPRRITKDVPEGLSRLVLQLLSLERGARPETAAEVMQRLAAMAELPLDENVAESRSYLSTPALVGRERQLLALRRRVLSLVRSEGGTVMIEGPSGSGRSRLLDACVLEAKLIGATVVRASASDAVSGKLGVARAIAEQLAEAFPERVNSLGRLQADVLSAVFPGLVTAPDAEPKPLPDRGRLIRELRDFVIELVRGQRLMIAVDDIDRIDEMSSAWLAALAHKIGKHPIVLAVSASRDTDFASLPQLSVLRDAALSVAADPLNSAQTEALLRSVFGDVVHLKMATERIFEIAQGSPRTTMVLAQHLVDKKLARYSAGAWSLPETLDDSALPNDALASLAAKVLTLGDASRALAEMLAVVEDDDVALDDYQRLSGLRSHAEVFRGLDTLVAMRVLLAEGDRYRFTQPGYATVLREVTPVPRRQLVCSRAADLLRERGAAPQRVAEHLLYAGREREAIELLTSLELVGLPIELQLIEDALLASERLNMPARIQRRLRDSLLGIAPRRFAIDLFRKHLGRSFELLERESGIADYRELSHLPESERLGTALTHAQARYDAAPEHERGLPVLDAIRELARYSANWCSIGMQTYDLASIEELPSLAVLEPLSPAIGVMSQLVFACRETLCGRTFKAREIYQAMLVRLSQPDRGGFDEAYQRGVTHAVHYLLGLVEAAMGMASAEQHAVACELDPEHRVNAWRIRVSLHLNFGNAEEARRCQRRAELLQLQEGGHQRYLGTSAGFELLAHVFAADLLGVKRATDAVGELAARFEGWKPAHILGLAHYRALQGDIRGALDALEPAHALVRAGRHPYYAYVAAAQISWLSELGNHTHALTVGKEHMAACERLQLSSLDRWVHQAYALALGRAGHHAEALALSEAAIATSERYGFQGVSLATMYEVRARIAIAMDDEPAFQSAVERCAAEYKKGKSPALTAKIARLLDEARKLEVLVTEPPPAAMELFEHTQTATELHTVQSLMQECKGDGDRGRVALTLLLNGSTSQSAHLYGVREAGLTYLASLPEDESDPVMHAWLEASLRAELETFEITETATVAGGSGERPEESGPGRYTNARGQTFEAIFLEQREVTEDKGQKTLIVAVVALHVPYGLRTVPPKDLLTQIAEQLLEHGDVVGISA